MVLQDGQQHGGNPSKSGAAFLTDDLHCFEWIKGEQRMQRCASVQRTQDNDGASSRVKEGHGITIPVAVAQSPPTSREHRIRDHAMMVEYGPLWEARRPRCVEDYSGIRRLD